MDQEDIFQLPPWKNPIYLIDFHRLGYHPWTRRFWQIKDLAQLLYSSEIPGLEDQDRQFFWERYGSEEIKGFWLSQMVKYKAGQYRRHNQKHLPRPNRPNEMKSALS
jgi:heptose I phosphotransferase